MHRKAAMVPATAYRICHWQSERDREAHLETIGSFMGYIWALIIRIGFWGPLYSNDEEPPPNSLGNYLGPRVWG